MTKRKYQTDDERLAARRQNGLNAVAKKKGVHAGSDVAASGGKETWKRGVGIAAFTEKQIAARGRKAVANWPPWAMALGRHRRFHVMAEVPPKNPKPCLFCQFGEERAKQMYEAEKQ